MTAIDTKAPHDQLLTPGRIALAVTLAAAATIGGLAGILATGRAPAYAQGTTVHWLRWNDFVPASDQLLRNKIAPEAAKAGKRLKECAMACEDYAERVFAALHGVPEAADR